MNMHVTMKRLTGKKALVTGGSRGIGAAIVDRLEGEEAAVAFTFRTHQADDANHSKKSLGEKRNHLAIQADSGDPEALRRAVDTAVAKLGGIDIFVSNAGTLLFKPIEQFTLEDFNHIVAVDLRAAYVGSKAVLSHMRDGGRIVFVSSNIADHAALPMTSLYSMAKSGLDGLCKGMARDLGPKGITVNTVHPGPINTDANPENGPYSEKLKSLMATPKYGRPEDVAGLVAYLVSDEASFASGAAYKIDNAFTA
jgi:3-oxoacyl-[acyl-carrier protein] reductase